MTFTGLLWFDDNPNRSLADKVSQAATRYQSKFGQRATVCLVNEIDMNGCGGVVGDIEVQVKPNMLRHHFFVGVDVALEKRSI